MTNKSTVIFFFFLILCQALPSAGLAKGSFSDDIRDRLEKMPPMEMDEVLWLAKCIYSESNRPIEQEHIAWVVRNRVETQYRGNSYREVVLEPLQFSIFNTNSPRRSYILGLNQNATPTHWQNTLAVALKVYESGPEDRPFAIETRHFYSPVSMKNNSVPGWAINATPLNSETLNIDPKRFLFYEEIDESVDPFIALKTPQDYIDTFKTEARKRLEPRTTGRTSLRDRWKPSGRVARPARPRTTSAKSSQRKGWD